MSSELEKPSFTNNFIDVFENEIRFYYYHGKGIKKDFLYSLPKKSLLTFLSSEDDIKHLVDWRCVAKPAKRIETDISTNGCSLSYIGFDESNISKINYPSAILEKTHVDLSYFYSNRNKYPDITDQDVENIQKQLKYLRSKDWFLENIFNKSLNWVAVDEWNFQHKVGGIVHNEHGPAEYVFRPVKQLDGKFRDEIELAKYYRNGVLHREDGPAWCYFTYWLNTATKTVDRKFGRDGYFYLNGNMVNIKGFIANLINKENTTNVKESNKKESAIMETKKEGKDFIGQFKSDSRQAGIRIACRKSVSVVQSTLIQLLSHGKSPKEAKSIKKGIDALFGSEYGKGLIGYIMGQALPVVKTKFPERYQDIMEELASEFRIEGMAVAGEEALNSILGLFKFAETGLIGAMTDLVEPIEKLRVQPEKQEKEIEQPKQETVAATEPAKETKEIG